MATDARVDVDGIAGRTQRLEILRLPDFLKTFGPIAPASLADHPLAKIETTEDPAVIRETLEILNAARPAYAEGSLDARASLTYWDVAGGRTLQVVFAMTSLAGTIDGKAVAFESPDLLRWLYARYPVASSDVG